MRVPYSSSYWGAVYVLLVCVSPKSCTHLPWVCWVNREESSKQQLNPLEVSHASCSKAKVWSWFSSFSLISCSCLRDSRIKPIPLDMLITFLFCSHPTANGKKQGKIKRKKELFFLFQCKCHSFLFGFSFCCHCCNPTAVVVGVSATLQCKKYRCFPGFLSISERALHGWEMGGRRSGEEKGRNLKSESVQNTYPRLS